MPESKSTFTKRIIGQSTDLKNMWSARNTMFKNWHELLSLVDENRVTGLESFTSNDPRTIYNMALFLLTPDTVNFNIPVDSANETEQITISATERYVASKWRDIEKASYKSGRQGWLRYLNSLMLLTGWYSVFSLIDGNDFIADIWHPAETYPWFDEKLGDVVHFYTCSASTARLKSFNNKWGITIRGSGPVTIMDYWCYNDHGEPRNTVIVNNELAKDEVYSNLPCIPVYISPVSGLPDMSAVGAGYNTWKEHVGESILAPNADVMRNYNRLLSFLLQTARDTAQPIIIEYSSGPAKIQPSDIGKRGGVFHYDKDDRIETLAMPGIPPEVPLQLQNMRAMLQRGGFADGLFTGVDGSGYLQSLVSASSQQVLRPFNQAGNHLLSDICNGWLYQIRNGDHRIPNLDVAQIPELAEFVIDNKVSVPGDLIQRATTARQLAPEFKLSSTTVLDLLFPEVKDPNREMVLARKDRAMNSEILAQVDLAEAMESSADALELDGDKRHAERYRRFSQMVEQTLAAQIQPQQSPDGAPGIGNAGMQ